MLKKGLINIDWNKIKNYSDEEITYFLSLEGKSIEAICKIRNKSKDAVEKDIIDGKIKYRLLVKSNDIGEFISTVSKAGKDDKILALNSLSFGYKNMIIDYIRKNYTNLNAKEKECAIWILGEIKDKSSMDILKKASVHKYVNIRRLAVSAMGKIKDISAENALMRALDDDNPQVVLYAIKALKKIGSRACVEKIKKIKDTSNREYLKRAVEDFLDGVVL